MPNGDAPKVKPWNDIAKDFDPMMPAGLYDNLRLKYFQDFVAPKVPKGKSTEATYAEFKKLTERPALLSPGGKAKLYGQVALGAAADSMLAPLKDIHPDFRKLHDDVSKREIALDTMGQREGMDTKSARIAGSFAGQAVDFAVLSAVLGPAAAGIAGEVASTAKTAELLSRTLRGGFAFGTYDALSAEQGNRLQAGVKGFATGAAFDLALGTPGYLKSSGLAKDSVEAEAIIQKANAGENPGKVIDSALVDQAKHNADVGRKELRPEKEAYEYSRQMKGSRARVRDIKGEEHLVEIKRGQEHAAYREILDMVDRGGSLVSYSTNPDDTSALNEFIRIITKAEEGKYNSTVIRTPAGKAEEVAKAAKAEGLPAEAIGGNTVEVATIPVQHPILNKPGPPDLGKVPQTPMTPDQIAKALEANSSFDATTRKFLDYHINKTWDPKIDYEDKRGSIIITARHTPELLPDEYKAVMERGKRARTERGRQALEAKAAEIEQVRQEEVAKPELFGKKTAPPPTTASFPIEDEIPRSEMREYMPVKSGVKAEGKGYNLLADAMDDSGDHRLLMNPPGKKPPGSQLNEATLKGRLMGSIEDVDAHDVLPFSAALKAKNPDWAILPIGGYEPGKVELVYFRIKDIPRVSPLIQVYDQFVSKQAGRIWDSDGNAVKDVGDASHRLLGKAFGVPEDEIATFNKERVRGSVPAPEMRSKPYGNRMILQQEDLNRLYPGAEAIASRDIVGFAKELGLELPPSVKGGEPLVILTPEVSKSTIFHERLHANSMHAGTFGEMADHVVPDHKQTALELAKGLAGSYSGYARLPMSGQLEEAYVHAATAIRYANKPYLEQLVRWDRSMNHILDFVFSTSNNLLESSFLVRVDSVPIRIFQRTLWDLMRRTSPEVSEALKQGIRITGSGISSWYDVVSDSWVLKDAMNSEVRFKDINDLWDYLNDRDKNFSAPSASLRAEMGGVRGPVTPIGREPDGRQPPVPELPLEGGYVGASAASALWRPFFPWLAGLHERMNTLWRAQGKYLPLYETGKAVDDQFRLGDRWFQDSVQEVSDLLKPFGGKKMQSVFDYLTYPEAERTTKLMEKYNLSQPEAQQAHKVWSWMKDFRDQTGINIPQYMLEYHPKLRGFSWAPERVFGTMGSPQVANYWDKLIRHDMKWDPQDGHLGRFMHTMLREGLEKKFIGKPLDEFEKLIERKSPDGTYIIPQSVRWPMTNYAKYMRGIPDTSQQIINKTMSEFFIGINKKIKLLNANLPKNAQIPEMTSPPREVLQRFMQLSYAMGLGMRPAIGIRDTFQAFTGGMTVLGPVRFTKAFTQFMMRPSYMIDLADNAGALLRKNNAGELLGDITGEIPAAGSGWMDRLARWSNTLLAPSRWGHNFGRAIMYTGEYHDVVEGIKAYRAGRITIDQLAESTSLWFMDRPAQTNLLRYISDVHTPVEDAAQKVALEAVDLTQWPYRRGTQPSLLRFGAGRIFGQYGVWPANYADFLYRIGRKWSEKPQLAARTSATWVAVNYALTHSMEAAGVDTSRWFWQSPAGFAGSPHWDFVHALMVAPENTDEGHAARKTILEYPLNFVPALSEMRSVARAIEEGGVSSWPPEESSLLRSLGFKPLDQQLQDQDWNDFIKTQLGYENTRRRR